VAQFALGLLQRAGLIDVQHGSAIIAMDTFTLTFFRATA